MIYSASAYLAKAVVYDDILILIVCVDTLNIQRAVRFDQVHRGIQIRIINFGGIAIAIERAAGTVMAASGHGHNAEVPVRPVLEGLLEHHIQVGGIRVVGQGDMGGMLGRYSPGDGDGIFFYTIIIIHRARPSESIVVAIDLDVGFVGGIVPNDFLIIVICCRGSGINSTVKTLQHHEERSDLIQIGNIVTVITLDSFQRISRVRRNIIIGANHQIELSIQIQRIGATVDDVHQHIVRGFRSSKVVCNPVVLSCCWPCENNIINFVSAKRCFVLIICFLESSQVNT